MDINAYIDTELAQTERDAQTMRDRQNFLEGWAQCLRTIKAKLAETPAEDNVTEFQKQEA